MSIPLVQEATKDAINTSIIAIKRNIERINMLLGLVDSGSPDLSGLATKQELQDAVTELQPVDEVTSGNMQSVTSNAVAESLSGLGNTIIPICTTFQQTSATSYALYKQMGSGIKAWFDSFPEISGKTKKAYLVFDVYTEGNTGITVALQRNGDTGFTVLLNNLVVWGGRYVYNYSIQSKVEIDPSFLVPYTSIYFKESTANSACAIGYVFAQVCYE